MELDLMALVSNLGFPAIVTMYLLIRIEGKLENLSTSINSLSNNIYELNNLIIYIHSIYKNSIIISYIAYTLKKAFNLN
ncbi:YvrJ family protein [Paraclostridium bifermentans]|uniref:YvrJ family protein n=1 Tax=Paraclostridium bifermentans TaxID=1490 RepID=UPI003D2E83B9